MPERLLVGRRDAARLCDLSERAFDRLRARGGVGPAEVKIGGSVKFRVSELVEWIEDAQTGRLKNRREWRQSRSMLRMVGQAGC